MSEVNDKEEEKQEEPDTLLVIGNGFDLACDLNSRFSNYFNFIEKEINTNDENALDIHLSFWDYYFLNEEYLFPKMNKDWSDVEKGIDNFFTKTYDNPYKYQVRQNELDSNIPESKYSKAIDQFFRNRLPRENNPVDTTTPNCFCIQFLRNIRRKNQGIFSSKLDSPKLYPYIYKGVRDIGYSLSKVNSKDENFESHYYEILFSELEQFENNLKIYLLNEVNKHDNYPNLSNDCFKKIVGDKNFNLLNFNYTTHNSLESPQYKLHQLKRTRNIHGSLSNNIIIGIDSQNIPYNSDIFHFTKAYQILMRTPDSKNNHEKLLSHKIKHIYFYGQSLSQADYTYFESIFDYLDLYGSPDIPDVDLTFCYTDFPGHNINNDIQSISNLINHYGDTLNEAHGHGKNILQTLLLEDRLHIKKI